MGMLVRDDLIRLAASRQSTFPIGQCHQLSVVRGPPPPQAVPLPTAVGRLLVRVKRFLSFPTAVASSARKGGPCQIFDLLWAIRAARGSLCLRQSYLTVQWLEAGNPLGFQVRFQRTALAESKIQPRHLFSGSSARKGDSCQIFDLS